jgi:hypothetical protein
MMRVLSALSVLGLLNVLGFIGKVCFSTSTLVGKLCRSTGALVVLGELNVSRMRRAECVENEES